MAEQMAKAEKFFIDTPPKASEPQGNGAENQDEDTIVVDTGDSLQGQSVRTTRTASVTSSTVETKTSDAPPKDTRRVMSPPAKGRRTPSPSEVNRRASVALKSDVKTPSPSKVDRHAPVDRAKDTKPPSPPKADNRAAVAQMFGTTSGKNSLKELVSELPGKLGKLLDLEQILNLVGPGQTETYRRLETVFATTIRHFEKDIEFVFQKEQEHLDDY